MLTSVVGPLLLAVSVLAIAGAARFIREAFLLL